MHKHNTQTPIILCATIMTGVPSKKKRSLSSSSSSSSLHQRGAPEWLDDLCSALRNDDAIAMSAEEGKEKGKNESTLFLSSSSRKEKEKEKERENLLLLKNNIDGWLEKARKTNAWRTRENVVDALLLPFMSAEYESAKREALFFPSFEEEKEKNIGREEEEEKEGEKWGVQNVVLKELSDAKLKAMYDEFFDSHLDMLSMNDVQSDLQTFMDWLESASCFSVDDNFKEVKRSTRVGRERIPSLRFNALGEKRNNRDNVNDVSGYLRKRNESLRGLRAKQSRALSSSCEILRSKFLAIVLEGFRHEANEDLLHETFFPRDPPLALSRKEDAPKRFDNKIYLILRAFCSEPTNASIVERCYKKAHVKSPCARRILRLCAEGCFETEKYEHVANARECDDEYPLRAMGDAVTKCKIAHGKDEFVCVRWMCRSKFEVDDVARKAFQDVYAEVTALEILRECSKDFKKKKRTTVKKENDGETNDNKNNDDILISYSFGTLRDYGACEDFLCVAIDWVDGVGLNIWRSNLGKCVQKDANEVNSDREVLFAIAKTMLQMVVVMHEKNIVHFDLKLEHFILTARAGEKEGTKNEITLIDFGECAVYDSSDKIKGTSRARGTETHHAPEMLLIDEMKNPGTSSFEKEGNCGNTTAAACLVDGKKCDCYALGVALCELFFGNSPNRHAYEQNGFLGLLNIVAGGDGDGEEYSRMLREDIVPSTASSCEARLGSPSDGDIANWLLQTLLVRDPHSRASARRALTTYSDMIK